MKQCYENHLLNRNVNRTDVRSNWLPSLDGKKDFCEIRQLPYAVNPYYDVENIHVAFPRTPLKHMIAVYHQVHHKINGSGPVIIYPTGSVSLVFCCHPQKPGAYFIGTSTHPQPAGYSLPGMDYFVVTFWPGRSYSFIPVPASELIDTYIPMQEFLRECSERITEEIIHSSTFEERISKWENFIMDYTPQLTEIPLKISKLVEEIWRSRRDENERFLLPCSFYSDRHIRRLFYKYVGVSPKLFADISRYQNILRALGNSRQQNILKLALDQGFFDQSHFIKIFRKFQGTTPGQFISEFLP